MKKKYLVLTFLLIFNYNFSQIVIKDSLKSLQKIEFNVFGLGLNYETPILKKVTLDSGIGLTSGYTATNDGISYQNNILKPCLYLKEELKYYYNFNKKNSTNIKKTKKRFVKGYKGFTKGYNSGSYFAFQSKYSTGNLFGNEPKSSNNVLLNEIHWGIQRKLFVNFLFNFNVGYGFANDFKNKEVSPYVAAGIKVSYILSRNKIAF